MASMFRKPRRNFRKKVDTNYSDDEYNEPKSNTSTPECSENSNDATSVVSKNKDKKKKSEKLATGHKTLLSFDHEEEGEGEIFKVRKSSHSKRAYKQLRKQTKQEKENQGLKEDLIKQKEKQANVPEEYDSDTELNGSEIPPDFEFSDEESEEEKKPEHPFRSVLERGEIPDANLIHLARKRRQMAREQGEFIPLDDTDRYQDDKSRLVRDDENDVSEDEDGRIDMALNKVSKERQQMKDDFLAAEHGSDDSDQEREWEEQQIRKAVSAVQIQEVVETPQMGYYYGGPAVAQYGGTAYTTPSHQQAGTAPTPLMETSTQATKKPLFGADTDTSMTISDVKRQLRERLDELQSTHRVHTNECDLCERDTLSSLEAITKCEEATGELNKRYTFFQETRGYVRDLVECMNEKVPLINAAELSLINILKMKADKLTKRRQDDIKDQSQDFSLAKVNPQKTISEDRQRRIAEREARRARRRRARIDRNFIDHHDGLSSDDEENQSDVIKFSAETERIQQEASRVFEDVTSEYCTFEPIKRQFELWKADQRESYTEAYISLCLPKLFTPLLRATLATWNPLEADSSDFDRSDWFKSLALFGFTKNIKPDPDDLDVKLVPNAVEKIIVPKVTVFIESVWDPMSATQTKNLVTLIEKLTEEYPTVNGDSKNTQSLLLAAIKRIRKSLDDDVFMPLYPKSIMANRSSGAYIFLQRQFWSCVKLIGNILRWHGVLSDKVIQELAVEGVLNRYVLLGLQCSEMNSELIEKCQVILKTFPRQWFEDLEGDSTLNCLQAFCRFLVSAALSMDKITKEKRDLDRKEARDNIKQITKILVTIHAMDHAISVSNQTSIRAK